MRVRRASLRVVLLPDAGPPFLSLREALSSSEQNLADAQPTERRRLHFALGRLAAHAAIRRVLGPQAGTASVEVLTRSDGAPVPTVNGVPGRVGVSVAHSGRLAAGCAWRAPGDGRYSAGIDLERIRASQLSRSPYPFSSEERTMLARHPAGEPIAGLAAWCVKEAVWKALGQSQPLQPSAIEVRKLHLDEGYATVDRTIPGHDGEGDPQIRARVLRTQGPDGPYILALAEVARGEASEVAEAFADGAPVLMVSQFRPQTGRG